MRRGGGDGSNEGVAGVGGALEEGDAAAGDGEGCHGSFLLCFFKGDDWDWCDQVENAQFGKRLDNNAGRGGGYDDGGGQRFGFVARMSSARSLVFLAGHNTFAVPRPQLKDLCLDGLCLDTALNT